jgi:hypothetical protein
MNEVSKNIDITYENINVKLADIVLDINKKRDFRSKLYFDLLVAIQFRDDRSSTLTHISGYGSNLEISSYHTLGIGGLFIPHLLERAWRPEMTMENAAALGYFCIKYEDYKLHSAVGIGDGEPQIHFIPDDERNGSGEKIDYDVSSETKPELFTRIKKDTIKRFNGNRKAMS